MAEKQYRVAEVFYSLQGEGAKAGVPSVFVRFAGCNLRCTLRDTGFDCDTDHDQRLSFNAEGLLAFTEKVGGPCRRVVFTGGEPTLQVDDRLVELYHNAGYTTAIETNGTRVVPMGIDWITVSPKPGVALLQALADEVRVVLSARQPVPNLSRLITRRIYLSPAFDGGRMVEANVKHCVNLCLQYPVFRLSLQLHKLIGIQ